MSGSDLKIKSLSALVRVNDLDADGNQRMRPIGTFGPDGKPELEPATKVVLLSKGDSLPDNLADGELERLKKHSALGTADEVAAGPQTVGAPAEPDTPKEPPFDKDAFLAGMPSMTGEELVAGITQVGAKKLVDAIGSDVELARRVLAAEKTASKGDGRSSLVKPLEKLIGGGAS